MNLDPESIKRKDQDPLSYLEEDKAYVLTWFPNARLVDMKDGFHSVIAPDGLTLGTSNIPEGAWLSAADHVRDSLVD